ncbi:MFS transporter [Paraburkholderia bonniea]|uniref:MFS transporter n=1 Tax=Paraburkholderia bonniea TaxID=2152891 RepID=UPI0012926C72|nr:MFS transporter [Paraburkholderia bonniea]WJF92185.1 MFS transporter [Paraburkholderia bonniea]WJF95504.1 MFS transporter [Paraburkholderia bonniea]
MMGTAFQRFWCARVLASVAFQMLTVAMGWHVYALTHDVFTLGLIGLSQFLPMFALTLLVGHVADRYNRKRIAVVCLALEALLALIFFLGALGGWLSVPLIFVLAVLLGAARAFEAPCLTALLSGVVRRENLPRATTLSTSAKQTSQILGPALGGLLYAHGASSVYAVALLVFACAAALIQSLRVRAAPVQASAVTFASIFSGMAFIWNEPDMLGALSLDLLAVLFGGATALLPIFAQDVLRTGPLGLGLLRSAPAVGALAGTLWISWFPLRKRPGIAMFGGVIAFGAATIVFAISHHFVLSLGALTMLGAADVISVVVRLTLVQLRTPDEMLGRVSAINSLFVGTSNQLGEFESGLTAGWWGAETAVLAGGVATITVALLWMRIFPQLTRVRQMEK